MSSPTQAARQAKRALASLSRPAGAFDASRYFRGAPSLGFYNVGTPAVRRLAGEIFSEYRDVWSIDDAMTFATVLVTDRYLEAKAVGIAVVARHRAEFTPGLLAKWKRWLADGYASNWATTDSICGELIGPLVVSHPELATKVAAWSGDSVLWVRRASAVALIASLRRKRALDLAYEVATRLRGDREDLIQKAVGWMLREAGKADLGRLERYLREHGPAIPRTTLRYAIERFPDAKRRALLAATRPV